MLCLGRQKSIDNSPSALATAEQCWHHCCLSTFPLYRGYGRGKILGEDTTMPADPNSPEGCSIPYDITQIQKLKKGESRGKSIIYNTCFLEQPLALEALVPRKLLTITCCGEIKNRLLFLFAYMHPNFHFCFTKMLYPNLQVAFHLIFSPLFHREWEWSSSLVSTWSPAKVNPPQMSTERREPLKKKK